jgi:hypothetical protein
VAWTQPEPKRPHGDIAMEGSPRERAPLGRSASIRLELLDERGSPTSGEDLETGLLLELPKESLVGFAEWHDNDATWPYRRVTSVRARGPAHSLPEPACPPRAAWRSCSTRLTTVLRRRWLCSYSRTCSSSLASSPPSRWTTWKAESWS